MLRHPRGATFATIVALTEPALTGGKSCPFKGRVFKVSRVNGVLWHNYANSVNNQREREGGASDFAAQPRKWGERVPHTSIVEHTNKTGAFKVYAELKVERSLGHRYVWADGRELDTAEHDALATWLRKSKQAETQQTEKEIILRDYNLENIVAINIDGSQYVIVPM